MGYWDCEPGDQGFWNGQATCLEHSHAINVKFELSILTCGISQKASSLESAS